MKWRSLWQTDIRDLARSAIDSVKRSFRSTVSSSLERELREALDELSTLREDIGYHGRSWTDRDLSPVSHELMLRMARWLWARSPIAKRALEIQRDFVVSEGFEFKATSKVPEYRDAVQAHLEASWKSEDNKWAERIGKHAMEAAQFGERTLFAFENPISGDVEWGTIAPEAIEEIVPNPLHADELQWIVLKDPIPVSTPDGVEERQRFRIMHRDRNPYSETHGMLVGDVVHLDINRLTGATRGLSDLLPVADYFDRLHQLIGNEADRMFLLKAFIWSVTVKGGDKAVKQRAAELKKRPPKPGSVKVGNEGEKWEAVCPDLKVMDSLEFLRFLMMLCLGGMGLPVYMFADAENVNRASAEEMVDPVYARVRERQNILCSWLHTAFRFELERKHLRGPLRNVPREHLTFEVVAKEPDRSEIEKTANALAAITTALATATAAGWKTDEQAAAAFDQACEKLGLHFPADVQPAPEAKPAEQPKGQQAGWMQRVGSLLNGKRGAPAAPAPDEKQAA